MLSFNIPELMLKECETSEAKETTLLGEERELAQKLTDPNTKLRFIAGRTAARKALAGLGIAPCAIKKSQSGAPIWPNNIVGSISHSGDLAIAVLSTADKFRSIGADLERTTREFDSKISERVLLPNELAWGTTKADLFKERLLMIFSAKEAIYKALSPLGAPVFWFHDLELSLRSEGEEFIEFDSSLSKAILDASNLESSPAVKIYKREPYILSVCTQGI